jgi:hypothetical protein
LAKACSINIEEKATMEHCNDALDFLMNYSHVSSVEVGNAFYGRWQSTVLIATVWYHGPDSTPDSPKITKTYHAFVSAYLSHSSLVFQKAFAALLPQLDLHTDVANCIILSDGGMQHFKNRISMHWGTTVFNKFNIHLCWIIDPAYHGNGECDGCGAKLKKKAKIHVLKEDGFLDTPEQLASYWNTVPGGTSSFLNIDWEDTEQDVQRIYGIKACYDFCFSCAETHLYMWKWPCICNDCLDFNFGSCRQSAQVGEWLIQQTKPTIVNHPKGLSPPVVAEQQVEHCEVEKIVGKRVFKNKVQYQIKWLSFTEDYNEWKYEDEMDCDDLVLAFENQYK